jgi:Uma2 family endonuclease
VGVESKFTYEDLQAFPDDGKRREIVDGELFVSASPNLRHQAISLNLALVIGSFLKKQRLGRLFTAPADVVLSDSDVVVPDLLFVSQERLDRLTKANVQGAPDLVIEILSPSTRRSDELVKKKRFEHFDVVEYWIVDPELDAVRVLRRTKKGLTRVAELTREESDVLSTPLLPGLEIPLAMIFADE